MNLHSPITIEALKVLDVIDRRGSYAAAAEELDKVPSALSYVVQKLEEQLNVTLFQKQGRRSVLTPAGKHLLDEGRILLNSVERLAEQTQNVARGYESRIRVAIDTIMDIRPVYCAFKSFVDEHPDIEIDIQEEALNGAWEVLISDDVDLVIGAVGPVPQQKGIRTEEVAQLDLVYTCSPDHPLAKSTSPIKIENLSNVRRVVTHDSAREAVTWTRGLHSSLKDQVQQRFYVPNTYNKLNAQKAGIGVGFLPRHLIREELKAGELVELPLDNARPQPSTLYMAWKMVNQGKGLQRLRTLIQKQLKEQE